MLAAIGTSTNVHDSYHHDRPWRMAALACWVLFLMLGLFSEHTFRILRAWGQVSRLNDLVGSPIMITLGWSAFLGFFAAARCRESGLNGFDARVRGIEAAILGGAAFFPFPLEAMFYLGRIPMLSTQISVAAIAAIKMGAFTYLVVVLTRYYLSSDDRAFLPGFAHEPSHRGAGADDPPVARAPKETPAPLANRDNP